MRKVRKMQIYFQNTKIDCGTVDFPEGASPLCAGVPVIQRGRLCPEVLASGKLVYRKVCSEGSQTAKVCTDEQVLQD
ncbi:MAG: hypothetical protein P1P88_26350 [Bacteroidales bacterium]|nr:hypothetical protein [Bacteroidales bacterium]